MGHVLNYTMGDVLTHFHRRHGLDRPAADGLGLVRPARRERRDPRGRPPARDRRAQHRRDPRADEAARLGDRLGPRGRRARAGLLPLDAVAVPALLRARARLPQGGAGELVPARPDRGRERVRDRRPLRALRHAGRAAEPRAVVLQDHRLRRRAAPLRGRRLARAHDDDPAQLDRPERGRRDPLPRRGARPRHPGLHHAARHAVRRDLLRARARAPARRAVRDAEVDEYVRRTAAQEDEERAAEEAKTGVFTGRLRDQPGERRALPDLGRRLRADGLRHRRDHGRARARRARPRVRRDLRPARSSRSSTRTAGWSTRSEFDGLPFEEAKKAIVEKLRGQGMGAPAVSYRLRDWSFGRQRYWGCPIPIVHCPTAARCPSRTTSFRCSCPRSRTTGRRACRRWPATRSGCTSSARGAAARPPARPTRWTRSSTRPGTSCATSTRATTRRRSTGG